MSDVGGLWLLSLGPAGATAVYWALYRHYRNTDKSHDFERETKVKANYPTGTLRKAHELKGLTDKRIRGENVRAYRQRVRRVPSPTTGKQQ